MRLLGTSKVSTDNKITVVKEAAEFFQLEDGDLLAFYQDDENNETDELILRKANFINVPKIFEALEILKKNYDKLSKPPGSKEDMSRLQKSMDRRLASETKLNKKDSQSVITKYITDRGW